MGLKTLCTLLTLASLVQATPTIDPSVIRSIEKGETTTVIVSFHGENVNAVRNRVVGRNIARVDERAYALVTELESHAEAVQGRVKAHLEQIRASRPIQVETLWITNQMAVKNADAETIQELQKMEDVSHIGEDRIIKLPEVTYESQQASYRDTTGDNTYQPGIRYMGGDTAHDEGYYGCGPFGIIDTGVDFSHPDLAGITYDWKDCVNNRPAPYDDHGHGTHCSGTAVGRNGIGMAPGVTTVSACKGCGTSGCPGSALTKCAQHHCCPRKTAGKCVGIPKVLSCSWGAYDDGSQWYSGAIKTMSAVDILLLFAAGNNGTFSRCGSVSSPASDPDVLAVGAEDIVKQKMANFSGSGPTLDGLIKPDSTAPGVNVVSSVPGGGRAALSGTSMATPHLAGLAMLFRCSEYGQGLSALEVMEIFRHCAEHDHTDYNTWEGCVIGRGRISWTILLRCLGHINSP